jgi:outer membrane protein assembly factor BamA
LWRGVKAFPQSQLESLIPVNDGEIFNRAEIAKNLEAAKNLYDSKGYINYVPIPTPQVDENARI